MRRVGVQCTGPQAGAEEASWGRWSWREVGLGKWGCSRLNQKSGRQSAEQRECHWVFVVRREEGGGGRGEEGKRGGGVGGSPQGPLGETTGPTRNLKESVDHNRIS